MENIDSADNKLGIQILIKYNENNAAIVYGDFVVSKNDYEDLNNKLYSAIVMVINLPSSCLAFNPFENMLDFIDDTTHKDNTIIGSFNFDLSKIINNNDVSNASISTSLGGYISNIETIK